MGICSFRLSVRILELRKDGNAMKIKMIVLNGKKFAPDPKVALGIQKKYITKNGKTFAEYWLDKEQMKTGQVSFV